MRVQYSPQFYLNWISLTDIYRIFQPEKCCNKPTTSQCCYLFTSDLPEILTAAARELEGTRSSFEPRLARCYSWCPIQIYAASQEAKSQIFGGRSCKSSWYLVILNWDDSPSIVITNDLLPMRLASSSLISEQTYTASLKNISHIMTHTHTHTLM